jgi:hypothetical protein
MTAIVMGIGMGGYKNWLRHKKELAKLDADARAQAEQHGSTNKDARIELLEDRVAVLERIVTEKSYNLAHEIESLRDSVSIEQIKRERDRV